jgi:methylmalonyl-CoA/ethylmalonyl-CoA epimerase
MKIDHMGIAVKDLEKTAAFYEEALGLEKIGVETVESEGVRVAFFKIGESKIELLEALNDESSIAKHIEKRGEGLHHIAVSVEGIEDKVLNMKDKGIRFIGDKPTKGAGGMKIIFVHPKSTDGVLMELCEVDEKGE